MKNAIFNSIAKGDIHSALELLKKIFDNNQRLKEVIVQSARYNSLKEEIRLGKINKENEEILKSKITLAILELADEIEEELISNPKLSPPDPISFNIKKEEGIKVVFKSRTLNRKDDIIIPKNITVIDLLEALKFNYDLTKAIMGDKPFDSSNWKFIINNMEYKGGLDKKVIEVPIREGDQIMIKGEFTYTIIHHGSGDLSEEIKLNLNR